MSVDAAKPTRNVSPTGIRATLNVGLARVLADEHTVDVPLDASRPIGDHPHAVFGHVRVRDVVGRGRRGSLWSHRLRLPARARAHVRYGHVVRIAVAATPLCFRPL